MGLNSFLTQYTKINLKWITSLNIGTKTKILGEKIEANLHDTGLDNYFLDITPKEKINIGL